jgi:PIN domain nuclease of toxin-antitoxin system
VEAPGVIVLDTHALPWMDRDDPALGSAARRLISGAWRAGQVAVSAISVWESAMLAQRGRIVPPRPLTARRSGLIQAGLRKIAPDCRIGILAAQPENFHRDPADRFMMATSRQPRAALITADEKFAGVAIGIAQAGCAVVIAETTVSLTQHANPWSVTVFRN